MPEEFPVRDEPRPEHSNPGGGGTPVVPGADIDELPDVEAPPASGDADEGPAAPAPTDTGAPDAGAPDVRAADVGAPDAGADAARCSELPGDP
jgi:hypothetical protein